MTTNIEPAASHDPGGKVRLKMTAGTHGSAVFSECGKHRMMLHRWWSDEEATALWIGMNPSTAAHNVDDPTVRREVDYTRKRLSLGRYAKANVMSYRATKPEVLLRLDPRERSHPSNIDMIVDEATKAQRVIAAWGALPKKLLPHAEAVEAALSELGIPLYCLGFTKDGSPRHPLYVRGDTELVRYPGFA